MTVHNIYYDRQSVADGPDMPGRVRVTLASLEQTVADTSFVIEHSQNKEWGRLGHWAEARSTSEVSGLSSAAYNLVEYHQAFYSAIGLPEMNDYAFDYAQVVEGDKTLIKRVIVSSPCWERRNDPGVCISDIIWRIRYVTFEKGTNPEKATLSRESDDALAALKFAVLQLLKAKVTLQRALRLPDTCNETDMRKAVESRATKRTKEARTGRK